MIDHCETAPNNEIVRVQQDTRRPIRRKFFEQQYVRELYPDAECVASDEALKVSRGSYPLQWLVREVVQNFVDANTGKKRGTLIGVDVTHEEIDGGKTRIQIKGNWVFEDPTPLAGIATKKKDGPNAGGNGFGIKQAAILLLRDFSVSRFAVEGEGWLVEYLHILPEESNSRLEAMGHDYKLKRNWIIADSFISENAGQCAYIIETDNPDVIQALSAQNFHNVGVSDKNEYLKDPDFENEHGAIKWIKPEEGKNDHGRLFINGQAIQVSRRGEGNRFWDVLENVSVRLNNVNYKINLDRSPISYSDFMEYMQGFFDSLSKEVLIVLLKSTQDLWHLEYQENNVYFTLLEKIVTYLRRKGFTRAEFEAVFKGNNYVYWDNKCNQDDIEELTRKGKILCPYYFNEFGLTPASPLLDRVIEAKRKAAERRKREEEEQRKREAEQIELRKQRKQNEDQQREIQRLEEEKRRREIEAQKRAEERRILEKQRREMERNRGGIKKLNAAEFSRTSLSVNEGVVEYERLEDINTHLGFLCRLMQRLDHSNAVESVSELIHTPGTFHIKLNNFIHPDLYTYPLHPGSGCERNELLFFMRGIAFWGIDRDIFEDIRIVDDKYVLTFAVVFNNVTGRKDLAVCRNEMTQETSQELTGIFIDFGDPQSKLSKLFRKVVKNPYMNTPFAIFQRIIPKTFFRVFLDEKGKPNKTLAIAALSLLLSLPAGVLWNYAGSIDRTAQAKTSSPAKTASPNAGPAVPPIPASPQVFKPTITDKYRSWKRNSTALETNNTSSSSIMELVYEFNEAQIEPTGDSFTFRGPNGAIFKIWAGRGPNGSDIVENFQILPEMSEKQKKQFVLLHEYFRLCTGITSPNRLFVFTGKGAKGINIGRDGIGLHKALFDVDFQETLAVFVHEKAHNFRGEHDEVFVQLNAFIAFKINEVLHGINEKLQAGKELSEREKSILEIPRLWEQLNGEENTQ